MNASRRQLLLAFAALACAPLAWATGVSDLDEDAAARLLRDSLDHGAQVAIARLGRENGYFGDARLKIGLPKNFAKAERYLRVLGMGRQVDDLVLAMNRTAEAALPQARAAVLESVRKPRMVDAKAILGGGDGAATTWFRQNSETLLGEKMAPIIHAVAERGDLVRSYGALSAKLVKLAGIKSELATVEEYVARKALDGLYLLIAEEENALRAQPLNRAAGVVGSLKLTRHY